MSNKDINADQFTQKDLMQHLLNVAHHTATREELEARFSELKYEIKANAEKIDSVRNELKDEIKANAEKIDSFRNELKDEIKANAGKIDFVRRDLNSQTWKLLTGLVVIMGLFSFLTKALS